MEVTKENVKAFNWKIIEDIRSFIANNKKIKIHNIGIILNNKLNEIELICKQNNFSFYDLIFLKKVLIEYLFGLINESGIQLSKYLTYGNNKYLTSYNKNCDEIFEFDITKDIPKVIEFSIKLEQKNKEHFYKFLCNLSINQFNEEIAYFDKSVKIEDILGEYHYSKKLENTYLSLEEYKKLVPYITDALQHQLRAYNRLQNMYLDKYDTENYLRIKNKIYEFSLENEIINSIANKLKFKKIENYHDSSYWINIINELKILDLIDIIPLIEERIEEKELKL